MRYIASISFGKDSLAMLLLLIEKKYPLDEVVFYDTGKEFQAIYNIRDKIKPLLEREGIKFTELLPPKPFDYMMFDHKTKSGKIGYGWCGGRCRWGTTYKTTTLDKIGCEEDIRYVGIAVDEPHRLIKERTGNKIFPLAEWNMTEKDCLNYCYSKGYDWDENGVELYSVLDRVSCWCCRNKNLKELKGIYQHLPDYWQRLKEIQARLPDPMKGDGKSIFDLERRFNIEIKKERVNKVKYNYAKLRGKIREIFKTEREFASAMNLSKATISAKLNNAVEFSQTEIDNACTLLGIDQTEISNYFFTPKVQ